MGTTSLFSTLCLLFIVYCVLLYLPLSLLTSTHVHVLSFSLSIFLSNVGSFRYRPKRRSCVCH